MLDFSIGLREYPRMSTYRLIHSFPYLVNRVGVRIGEMFGRRLRPYGVSLPMYRVLAALWESPDQRLFDLGTMTSIDVSTLSRLVGTLVRRGLLTRTRLPENSRTVSIKLTAKGRALATELIPLAIHFEEVAIHSFGKEDVNKLKQDLATVFEHLNQLEPEIADALQRPPARGAARRAGSRLSRASASRRSARR